MAGELICFVKDFSLNEVKKHLVETLQSWTFTDWETPFAAKAYRGYRISEKLIYFANGYAEKCGFLRTYKPSKHIGLYEKYGYRYLKHIVNYDNETERLYVKELNNIAF